MKMIRKLFFGSTLRVGSLAVNVIVGFFLMPFIVHSLGDRYYGYWTLVGTILGYYGLLDLGIVSAVQYQVARCIGQRSAKEAAEFISTAFFTFTALGGLMFLITIVAASLSGIFIQNPEEGSAFRQTLLVGGIGLGISFPCRVFVGVLSANLRFDLLSLTGVGALLLRSALTVLVLKGGHGIVGLSIITVITDLIVSGVYYVLSRRLYVDFQIAIRLANRHAFRQIFGYSAFAFIIKIGEQLKFYVHALIVSGFLGLVAVTHYSIASRLSMYFLDLMVAMFGLLSPAFSQSLGSGDRGKLVKVFLFSSKLAVCVGSIIALVVMAHGRAFIKFWMGKGYDDAYAPLVVLFIGFFFELSQIPASSYLLGVAKHRVLAWITIAEAALNVLLTLFLVKRFGLLGVALGMAIPQVLLRLGLEPVYVCRHAEIPTREYYLQAMVPILTRNIVGFIVCLSLYYRRVVPSNLLEVIVLMVAHGGVLLSVGLWFVPSREERAMVIAKALRRWT